MLKKFLNLYCLKYRIFSKKVTAKLQLQIIISWLMCVYTLSVLMAETGERMLNCQVANNNTSVWIGLVAGHHPLIVGEVEQNLCSSEDCLLCQGWAVDGLDLHFSFVETE